MLRILYNSRDLSYKDPFGTITPGQPCTLRMQIPQHCQTRQALCRLLREDGTLLTEVPMNRQAVQPPYETWTCQFTLEPGLYFYFFRITTPNETFSLLRQGEDTNMEAGDWWQLSCIPEEAETPAWARGATIYQVFPDRFAKSGSCDLTGKLEPYTLHQSWAEEVHWQPTDRGEVLNNDFFGGNFRGITEKLPYIASLGATILYLNPIFKAFSSHRYDTGDYKTPDPMLGTEADFVQLCQEARKLGIHVILDGVFSHTGSNSLYFDRYRAFGGHGAYADPQSPYGSWYQFYRYPDSYNCWWNFDTLPCVNKMDPSYLDYIMGGPDSVVAHWLRLGADGFRLDVVDELPDEFVLRLKKRVRELKPDALLIGEVWEDASNKIAYDVRRRYFVDGELDGVMNYPYRKAILDFLRQRDDGKGFREAIMTLAENYPPQVLCCCMNLLGTHDTPRILTALIDDFEGSRAEKAARHLSPGQLLLAKERLRMASFLQFVLPGAPTVYYGDEAGMEGYADPFNRRTYPWGREDPELLAHYRRLGQLRRDNPALRGTAISFFAAANGRLSFRRCAEGPRAQQVDVYVNRSGDPWEIPTGRLLLGHNLETVAPDALILLPGGFCALEVS